MGLLSRATRRGLLAGSSALVMVGLAGVGTARAENVLKIGVLGVMSGPAASWGLVNKYCAQTTAQMYNEKGGVDIGGEKYKIEIVPIDDKNDPKLTVSGAERLTQQEKIRYIIGPNVDTTAASVRPVAEKNGAIYFPYAFSKSLYTPPAGNAILGMIASYQAGPIIYKYLMDKKGAKSVAFVARNESDPLNQRNEGVEAAKKLGLTVLSAEDTYEPGTTDFYPVMSKVVGSNPDLIVLSGVAPADAPLLIRTAARARLPGHAQHRDRPGRQGHQGRRGRRRRRLHLGRRRQHARDPQRLHGGLRQALRPGRRRVERRGRHQGLRARDHPAPRCRRPARPASTTSTPSRRPPPTSA